MQVIVDQDTCISCGACVSENPEVFQFNDDQKAEAIQSEVPGDKEDAAKNGRDVCPVNAIDVKE